MPTFGRQFQPCFFRIGFLIVGCVLAACTVFPVLSTLRADDEKSVAKAKSPVMLTAGTWKDVEALIAANRGKVVIVDIWSTSCLPCMTEFPHLVTLQKSDRKNLVCVSFNVDYVGIKSKPAETYRERVEKFLKKEDAALTNFLCTVPSDVLFEKLQLVSIPAVYVYGRDGKLARRFDESLLTDGEEEAFTYATDINPFLRTLLGKSATE